MQGSKWLLWVTEHWNKAMRFASVDTVYLQEDFFAIDVLDKTSSWSYWCKYVQCYTCVDPGSSVGLLMYIKLLVCLHVQGSGHWRDLIIKRWNRGIFCYTLLYCEKSQVSLSYRVILLTKQDIQENKMNQRQHCFVAI